MAGAEGIEPALTVLETAVLPLYYAPTCNLWAKHSNKTENDQASEPLQVPTFTDKTKGCLKASFSNLRYLGVLGFVCLHGALDFRFRFIRRTKTINLDLVVFCFFKLLDFLEMDQ